jgi:hypothetical protein
MAETREEFSPIGSENELRAVVEAFQAANPDRKLLFRGQNRLYDSVRSGLARPDARYQPEVEQGMSAIVGKILGHESTTIHNIPFRRAVLQHYGVPTHYIDLTSDVTTAAWFAINSLDRKKSRLVYGGTPLRMLDRWVYQPSTEGLAYVLILSLPKPDELLSNRILFDISTLEPFLRPSRQKAWLIMHRPPLLPDPNDFWAATITIDCTQFKSEIQSSYLFPLPSEDAGYKSLLRIPFVEVPGDWLQRNEPPDTEKHGFTFGIRALPVPECVHELRIDEYNHKWEDVTLTEPKPMQNWVKWQFPLTSELPGVYGDVSKSVKLTVSPKARKIMAEAPDEFPLRWPRLDSDEILFTFAQNGYDKVLEIEFPYHGVWLHRDKELVIEHPVTADRETMNVHTGHVFEFIGQDLHRYDLPTSCTCGLPEEHEARVRAMLKLTALIEDEILTMITHPLRIPNWYIVLE